MIVKSPVNENEKFSSWKSTIGRVAFMNCDPLFLKLSKEWNVLAAPPSWLTGHLLRRDCIIAPIPAAVAEAAPPEEPPGVILEL